jgi:hypothetical protein
MGGARANRERISSWKSLAVVDLDLTDERTAALIPAIHFAPIFLSLIDQFISIYKN